MGWFLGIAAALGFAFLMYVSPKFRDFGCGLIAIVILGVALLWFYSEKQNRDFRAQLKREQEAISAADLKLTDFTLDRGVYSWELAGTVKNDSPHQLRRLTLTVSIIMCDTPQDQTTCVVMGEDETSRYLDIPQDKPDVSPLI